MIFTLLDSLIVGGINAAAMLVLRMPHVGLISIIVGVTNMIPTFGPVIGGAIGALFLLLQEVLLPYLLPFLYILLKQDILYNSLYLLYPSHL